MKAAIFIFKILIFIIIILVTGFLNYKWQYSFDSVRWINVPSFVTLQTLVLTGFVIFFFCNKTHHSKGVLYLFLILLFFGLLLGDIFSTIYYLSVLSSKYNQPIIVYLSSLDWHTASVFTLAWLQCIIIGITYKLLFFGNQKKVIV